MSKLCKELVDQISKKWPETESFLYTGSTMYQNEITVTCVDAWFITLSLAPDSVTATVHMVTGSVKTGNRGYQYLKEYQIGEVEKDGKYPVRYMQHFTGSRLLKDYWPLSELITDIEMQITQSDNRPATKIGGQDNQMPGMQSAKR